MAHVFVKGHMKTKAGIFFILIVILFGCSKDGLVMNGTITDCPINSTCSYLYHENADYTNVYALTTGQNRVFVYKSIDSAMCNAVTTMYFKADMSSNSFEITAKQITLAQVASANLVCTCCDIAPFINPIGGDIRGTKKNGTTWLINAEIIEGDANSKPIDTVVVNQYFTLSTAAL
jgi:hypothetical protein